MVHPRLALSMVLLAGSLGCVVPLDQGRPRLYDQRIDGDRGVLDMGNRELERGSAAAAPDR